MRRLGLTVLGLLLSAGSLAAQAVVMPEKPIDPPRAKVRDALLVFRDSLLTVDAAAARLPRDLRTTSDAAALARARGMRDACERSAKALPLARTAVMESNWTEVNRRKSQAQLQGAMDSLGVALDRCLTEFRAMSSGPAEEVRGYAVGRANRAHAAVQRYNRALNSYFQALDIKVRPVGGPPSPIAG